MAKLAKIVYGDALYDLAQETDRVDELYEAAKVVLSILEENGELENVLSHPKIVKEEKIRVVKECFSGRVPDEITGLLALLVEKNHSHEMRDVLSFFIARIKEFKKIGIAWVSTAVPLTEAQKAAVEKRLLETTSYLQFEMNYKTDPSLIGGVVIRINDRVIDSSIKSKLYALTRDLSQIQISNMN